MSGEDPRARPAIDRMVEREKNQAEKDRKRFNPEQARQRAIEDAKRHDQRRK